MNRLLMDAVLKLFVNLEYNSEMFERKLELNKRYDEYGYIILSSPEAREKSYYNYKRKRIELEKYLLECGITEEELKAVKNCVNKLTFNGLQILKVGYDEDDRENNEIESFDIDIEWIDRIKNKCEK